MSSRTAPTALSTPLPPYRALSPSRSSTASNAPVEAPLGTAAWASVPSSSATSTSTVGLPRESRISRAPTASMLATVRLLMQNGYTERPQPIGRDPSRVPRQAGQRVDQQVQAELEVRLEVVLDQQRRHVVNVRVQRRVGPLQH